jgi:putative transposase
LLPTYSKSEISKALGFSRGLFYYCYELDHKDKFLAEKILEIHLDKDDTLGSRLLSKMLKTSRETVQRVMAKYGLQARRKRIVYSYPGKADKIFDNLLLNMDLSNHEVVFSDIFEFRLADRSKIYCCFAIRKKTRQIISFVYSYHRPAELVLETLNHIDLFDLSKTKAVWHTDQGSQYGAKVTISRLLELGFTISMSRAGTPTDNGMAERFVGTFKLAVVEKKKYSTLGDFIQEAEKWLNFYNQERPHSSLGYLSPNQSAIKDGLENISYLTVNGV